MEAKAGFLQRGYMQRLLAMIVYLLRATEDFSEPESVGRLAGIVRSRTFQAMCVTCIALNSFSIAYTTDYGLR